MTKHQRGIFERPKGSGVWWIRYADGNGRERREKAGTKGMAINLYRVRKTEVRRRRAQSQLDRVFDEFTAQDDRIRVNDLYHQHVRIRRRLGMPNEFVVHSLRHTFCSRLGEAGAEAFLIMRLAGHYSVSVSERYVHPTPDALVRAIKRLDAVNQGALSEVSTGTKTGTSRLATSANRSYIIDSKGLPT